MRPSVFLQYLLPKQALTALAGRLASAQAGMLTRWAIRRFATRYRVNMEEAAQPDLAQYPSFNAFFTRALAPGARPLALADQLCPVDGTLSQLGRIEADQIFQAKGHRYSTRALLGNDEGLATLFQDGLFATIYLSPRDYHRIHMPCSAGLRRMVHVPGDLFSVNPDTAEGVPGLFARNERVVCVFETVPDAHGVSRPFVLVLVGATIVGSMATVWHGVVNPPRPGTVRTWHYPPGKVELVQGQEMGRFLLGSTVVMLWPRDTLEFEQAWRPGLPVRMGEAMGHQLPSR